MSDSEETLSETDLAVLFKTDPLELTDDNVDDIVKALRRSRHTFMLNEEKNRAAGKKPKVMLTGMTASQLIL